MPFNFEHGMNKDYVGPGNFFLKSGGGFAEQTAQDVCWCAALTCCINGAHGANIINTRDVAAMCKTDLFQEKGLQPNEFREAAGMVVNSNLCKMKLKLVIKKWSDGDAIAAICDALEDGDTAMISVAKNNHVQVVVGCTTDREKLLLYDTASKDFQRLGAVFLKNHEGNEWIYIFRSR